MPPRKQLRLYKDLLTNFLLKRINHLHRRDAIAFPRPPCFVIRSNYLASLLIRDYY